MYLKWVAFCLMVRIDVCAASFRHQYFFFANFQHLINLLITLYSQGYSLTHLILLPKCNSTKARNFKSELDYQKTKNLRSFQNKATQGGGKGEYKGKDAQIYYSFNFNFI